MLLLLLLLSAIAVSTSLSSICTGMYIYQTPMIPAVVQTRLQCPILYEQSLPKILITSSNMPPAPKLFALIPKS